MQRVYQRSSINLLIFASGKHFPESLRQTLESEYQDIAELQVFNLDERAREVFGTDHSFVVLLRPDNHIAFLSPDISLKRIQAYFKEFIGSRASGLQ